MHLRPLSGMSSSTAHDGCASAGVKERTDWAKAHTSAVVLIPPDNCWPQIQDIRRSVAQRSEM